MRLNIRQNDDNVTYELDNQILSNDSALWSYGTPRKFSNAMWEDIYNLFNGDSGKISFYGDKGAYQLFSKFKPEKMLKFGLEFIDSNIEMHQSFESKLNEWFEKMLSSDILSEHEQKAARLRFQEATNNVFVVNVLAKVSAGKSTLINALLGQQLMPSNNNAETAKITQIIDNDSPNGFTATALDKNGNQMYEVKNLTPKRMDNLNDDPSISSVRLTGDIPFAKSIDYALELVDTPGPDNAMNRDHHLQFDKLITRQNKNGFKPVVLYIIPSDSIGTDSTDELLNIIRKESDSDYQNSVQNRFIFVISKMDNVKATNVLQTLDTARDYLMNKGIKNPVVIPVSAELALNLRRDDLTDEEDLDELEFKSRKQNKHSEFHFDELATTNNVRMNESSPVNEKEEALQHSGIPTLETQIEKYVNDYAAPERLARLDMLTDHFLSEATKSNEISADLINSQDKLEKVEAKLQQAKDSLDDGVQKLQDAKLVDIADIQDEIEQMITNKQSSLSQNIIDIFKNYNPLNNIDRATELASIVDKLIDAIMSNYLTIEDELSELSQKKHFTILNDVKVTDTTKDLLRHGFHQIANMTMVDDAAMGYLTNKKTILQMQDYCQNFESKFNKLLQRKLIPQIKDLKNNLAAQIEGLTKSQFTRQQTIDQLMQVRGTLIDQVDKLTVAKQLYDTKPRLQKEIKA